MIPDPNDTIAALSSAPGPGARAVVRVGGPAARAVVDAVFRAGAVGRNRHAVAGEVRLTGVFAPLPASLLFFRGPASYTGQDLAELHLFSSPPLVERLLADLLAAGARPARPGEFTLRAFLAGKLDLTQAEAVHAIIEAGTDDDLKQALAQLGGNVGTPLTRLRSDLLDLLADVEAGLDFADEDLQFVSSDAIRARVRAGEALLDAVADQLDARGRSDEPMRAALVGAPNAGKSSLFNALVGGDAALVSAAPGTTRDYLRAVLPFGVELVDTAGLAETTDGIDAASQNLGRSAAARADLVLWCVPDGEPTADLPVDAILVRTKCDGDFGPGPPVRTSARVPGGVAALQAELAARAMAFARATAPSASRCRHHIRAARLGLARASVHALQGDPAELLALSLREAIAEVGEMVGAVYTNDLLDRIFSRFCIGK